MNKICICFPHTYDKHDTEFVDSLLQMIIYFNEWCDKHNKKYYISYLTNDGFQLDKMRNDLVFDALKSKQDYILFLDTDMTFPKETIAYMIEDFEDNKDQNVDVICGVSVLKHPPYKPVLFPSFNKKSQKYQIVGTFPLDELFELKGVGMACTMIRKETFQKMKPPYFKFVYKGENEKFPHGIGEDLYFCHEAEPFILCDSRIITGHLRKNPYTIDDYIDYNGLKKTEKYIEATDKQLKKIASS